MTCDRYWREGIVLIERGLDDPHRDGCADCKTAHASRQELIDALPGVGASQRRDPHWQASVWRRIDAERARAPRRWRWQLSGALAAACVVALWLGVGRTRSSDARPRSEILRGSVAMRSDAVHVDDHLRITVGKSSEVWIYRGNRLVLRCRAGQASDRCTPDADGMIVELVLSMPGTYRAVVIEEPVATPRGGLDEDRAALEAAGAHSIELPAVTVR